MGERWSRLGGYMDQLCREGISGAQAWCTRARQSVVGGPADCGMWSGDWRRMGIPCTEFTP